MKKQKTDLKKNKVKAKIIAELKDAVRELKLIKSGKIKSRTADSFLKTLK